ncbi:MAG: hypothetical protein F4Y04_02885 [Chloroflexi bacterium]|nr:hypothetical protein [Chloroflexota bacterium]
MSTLAVDSTVLAALIGAGGAVVVGIVGIVGILVSSKRAVAAARETAALNQQHEIANQVWNLRRLGYSVVVAKLGEASMHATSLDDGFQSPGMSPEHFWDSDRYTKLSAEMWNAWADCRSEFEKNRLTCSDGFAERFRQIHESLSDVELTRFDPLGRAIEVAACFRRAHSDLLSMAVAELGLKPEAEAGATEQTPA